MDMHLHARGEGTPHDDNEEIIFDGVRYTYHENAVVSPNPQLPAGYRAMHLNHYAVDLFFERLGIGVIPEKPAVTNMNRLLVGYAAFFRRSELGRRELFDVSRTLIERYPLHFSPNPTEQERVQNGVTQPLPTETIETIVGEVMAETGLAQRVLELGIQPRS